MSEQVLINDGRDVIEWDGAGWYADCGRWDTDGKSFTQGVKVAGLGESRQEAELTAQSWGRGTPYKLTEQPNENS